MEWFKNFLKPIHVPVSLSVTLEQSTGNQWLGRVSGRVSLSISNVQAACDQMKNDSASGMVRAERYSGKRIRKWDKAPDRLSPNRSSRYCAFGSLYECYVKYLSRPLGL